MLLIHQDHLTWTDMALDKIIWADKADGTILKEVESLNPLGVLVSFSTFQQPLPITSEYHEMACKLKC